MHVVVLGSGSAGNSFLFESGSTRILVDAGFGIRETRRRLARAGRSIESITAIVLTHEHGDHSTGAEPIARKYGIPIHLTRGTLQALGIDTSAAPVVVFENDTSFRIGEFEVHAQRTTHDAADSACFVIEEGDGTRTGIASDLGCVDAPVMRHLSGCDGLFFESNHDLDMLRLGDYPWSLKRRIMSRVGHLSNDDSMVAVRRMIGPETRTLCLIHLSSKNNHASIVRAMAEGVVASLGAPVDLTIAPQEHPSKVYEISRQPVRRRAASGHSSQLRLF